MLFFWVFLNNNLSVSFSVFLFNFNWAPWTEPDNRVLQHDLRWSKEQQGHLTFCTKNHTISDAWFEMIQRATGTSDRLYKESHNQWRMIWDDPKNHTISDAWFEMIQRITQSVTHDLRWSKEQQGHLTVCTKNHTLNDTYMICIWLIAWKYCKNSSVFCIITLLYIICLHPYFTSIYNFSIDCNTVKWQIWQLHWSASYLLNEIRYLFLTNCVVLITNNSACFAWACHTFSQNILRFVALLLSTTIC